MPFFPVDDRFWGHPKADDAGDAAIGLWTRAGSYCANYLTEGALTAAEVRKLGARAPQIRALVDAGLWHAPGHECPRCPQPPDGGYQFHEWNKNGNRTREQVEADRAAAAERQRRARARRPDLPPPDDDPSRRDSAARHAVTHAVTHGVSHGVSHAAQARPGQGTTKTPLLTLAGRLTSGDARASQPAEQIRLWQDLAGPHVDLEVEARAYLERYLDRPARDERGAWLGWLKRARERTPAVPSPRQSCGDPACRGGWLTTDPDQPVPCRTCRPHLRATRGEAS